VQIEWKHMRSLLKVWNVAVRMPDNSAALRSGTKKGLVQGAHGLERTVTLTFSNTFFRVLLLYHLFFVDLINN